MLTVLRDRVLVKPESQREYEASGLYVADDDAPDVMGTVIACAEGLDVQADDVVIFPPSAGQVMEHNGERLIVLEADEILAVVE